MIKGGDKDRDSICAISTPSGVGGISVIRLSGPESFKISGKLAKFLPEQPESHRVYFGTLSTLKTGESIDEVLVTCFRHGKSFTGEETVEISCHGSVAVANWILQELILAGARLADRGEFSYRAFMNGKIDLIQAEAVLEIIESRGKRAAKQGLRQLKGGLSKEIATIKESLLSVSANIEAAIDFSTEDIEVLDKFLIAKKLSTAAHSIGKLKGSYQKGRILKDGLYVALSGAPNVGKSSLFNLLLEEDRSIVTHIPGTTRDIVEAAILLDGARISLMDTAGIRVSDDLVEQIGIQKSKESHESADLIFFLFDAAAGLTAVDVDLISGIDREKIILLGNKIDQSSHSIEQMRQSVISALKSGKFFKDHSQYEHFVQERVFFISTLEHKSREIILNLLKEYVGQDAFEDEAVVSQARHFEALALAESYVQKAIEAMSRDAEIELIALDLKAALLQIQSILGERYDDQIMDFVFKQFCIGK